MLIYSWKFHSRSAKLLSSILGARVIRPENSKLKGEKKKIVINWGSSELPKEVAKCTILNPPEVVKQMTNKLHFFEMCKKSFRIPPFTTDKQKALAWLGEHDVCARTVLNGHSANGLVLVPRGSRKIPDAPLYTKYIPKINEYRIHCFKGTDFIFIQRKARSRDIPDEEVNWQIRNLEGGFVYVGADDAPEDVEIQAYRAFQKTGLDFGAVDVIYNAKGNKAYVLEINTAPGLEQRTAELYATALQERSNALLHL